MTNIAKPDVIFLDAVGTLFGVNGSVGKIYGNIARDFGVDVSEMALNKAFRDSFRASTPPAFLGVPIADIPQHEYAWWRTIAAQTFTQAGVFPQFADFDACFTDLYGYFTTAAAWVVYPDVQPTLEHWRSLGIRLGVLSNFDSRLYRVLTVLKLADYFSTVTISTTTGAAKPDARIFKAALQQAGSPAQAWHIGDSYTEDYQGAIAAGLRGIWIERHDDSVPLRSASAAIAPTDHIYSLSDITKPEISLS